MASVGGITGGAAGAAYTASTHGLVGLTRSVAWYYAEDGIRCNVVCPGGVQTDPPIYLLLAAWAIEGMEGVPVEAIVIGAIVLANGALTRASSTDRPRAPLGRLP